eukprot:gene11726-14352_t
MTSMNLKRLLPNRVKKERSQPESTLKHGFMERHKDYVIRAKDFNEKKEAIKKLKLKAALKNPDEFNFKMISSKLVDGVHKEKSKTQLSSKEIIDIKTQDILYLQSKRLAEENKIKRLEGQLRMDDDTDPTQQIIYVDNEDDVKHFSATKYFDTVPEAFTGEIVHFPKLSNLKSSSIVVNPDSAPTLGAQEAMVANAHKQLAQRKQRRDQLFEAESKLNISKIKLKNNNASNTIKQKVGKTTFFSFLIFMARRPATITGRRKPQTTKSKRSTVTSGGRVKSKQQQHKYDEDESMFSEDSDDLDDNELDYFTLEKPNKTSNNNLSNIEILSLNEIHKELEKLEIKHKEHKIDLFESYTGRKFSEMYNDIKLGYNVLLYGFGSKRTLISNFISKMCTDGPAIDLIGYDTQTNIKDLLYTITHILFKSSTSFTSLMRHCEYIKTLFKQQQQEDDYGLTTTTTTTKRTKTITINHLYLAIHNIDGRSLRQCQNVLASLADIPQIHIIASIDHLNAPFLWDLKLEDQFRWIRHSVPTYQPYHLELQFEHSILNSRGAVHQPKSILFVLNSLTPAARKIFQVLVELLIADRSSSSSNNSKSTKGISFSKFYEECFDRFLVSSEAALKNMLVEYHDHKIITERNDKKVVYLNVSTTESSLNQILIELKKMNPDLM